MERTGGVPGRRRWARVPVVVAGLLLMQRALVAAVGTPVAQAQALRSLATGPVDPVAPLLAALALLAEALIGYLLAMLVLRSLCALPGSVGRLAGRAALVASPVLVCRLLDVLVGGTLLAQATLATMPERPSGPRTGAVHMAQTASRTLGGAFDRAASRSGSPVMSTRPVEARPSPRRPAAPLPPWLGGGPSRPAPGYTVAAGDSLWDIAAARLAPAERSSASVHRYWRQIYRANRPVVGADPNLIHPGMRLAVPPFRPSGDEGAVRRSSRCGPAAPGAGRAGRARSAGALARVAPAADAGSGRALVAHRGRRPPGSRAGPHGSTPGPGLGSGPGGDARAAG